jgi:hypothetical protein
MMDRKIDHWADSPYLKLVNHLITVIGIPIALGLGWRWVDKLDKIDSFIATTNTNHATMALRVELLEKQGLSRDAAIDLVTRKSLDLDYRTRRLEDLRGLRPDPGTQKHDPP